MLDFFWNKLPSSSTRRWLTDKTPHYYTLAYLCVQLANVTSTQQWLLFVGTVVYWERCWKESSESLIVALCVFSGQSVTAMEMLSAATLSYCHLAKNEGAACRALLTLCKWLVTDWKDMAPQLKQVLPAIQHRHRHCFYTSHTSRIWFGSLHSTHKKCWVSDFWFWMKFPFV